MTMPLVSPANTHATPFRSEPKSIESTSAVELLEHAPQTPLTINELIQQRASEEGCDEPIAAYPSKGGKYHYYTPKQVSRYREEDL